MSDLTELRALLDEARADYALIAHATPIRRTADAAGYFDTSKAAPALVVRADETLLAVIVSATRGRLDLDATRAALGYSSLEMADRTDVRRATGFDAGAVPLVGHGLPVVFDRRLLNLDHVYGGTGDPLHTLKIAPADLQRLSNPGAYLDL